MRLGRSKVASEHGTAKHQMHRYTEVGNADRKSLRRPAGVAVMQATDLGILDDLPVFRWLDRPRFRRILLQRQMRSRTMVVTTTTSGRMTRGESFLA
jgi:hypothetical protein